MLAVYAVIATAMVAFQLRGVVQRRTLTIGDVVGMAVKRPVMRWLLLTGWLWWGWHVFVRATL